jgi:3-oxoadipate enol-lactonase
VNWTGSLSTAPRRITGTLRLSESEITYEVTGTGPALVFAHGIGGNHLSWWQQVPHFCDRYSCVTFSHRGFPPSVNRTGAVGPAEFASDLAALVDHLELKEVCLVAQSMGGWTCLTFARERPRMVRALVMSSTTGTVDFAAIDHPEIEGLGLWTTRAEAAKEELASLGILAATGARMATEQPVPYFLYRELYDLTPTVYKDRVRKAVRSARSLGPQAVAGISTPTLFVVGEEDLIFPPGAAAATASLMPDARLVRVPAAGHSVYFERPDLYNRTVDAFLSEKTGIPPRVA